jgi:hypothetical protein
MPAHLAVHGGACHSGSKRLKPGASIAVSGAGVTGLASGKVPHRACCDPPLGPARQLAGSTPCRTPPCSHSSPTR